MRTTRRYRRRAPGGYPVRSLDPTCDPDESDPVQRWITRHGLNLTDLSKANLAMVDLKLGLADAGTVLGARTAGTTWTVARSCVERAVQLDLLAADPRPPAANGRAARKINRTSNKVDVHSLPDPATIVRILDAMASHQPARSSTGRRRVYFAGLRPSEVVMLRRPSPYLLTRGTWGRIDVTGDVDHDPGRTQDRTHERVRSQP